MDHSSELLHDFERALHRKPSDLAAARAKLREWLFIQAECEPEGSTLDAIEALCKNKSTSDAVFIVLRSLAVPHLLPAGGATKFPQRSFCELLERTAPQLVTFLGANPKDQPFKRYQKYETAHSVVESLLVPLTRKYPTVESIVSSRKEIFAALNHGIVKLYGECFGISEIRRYVESIIAGLKRVHDETSSLLSDIEDTNRAIAEAESHFLLSQSFLSLEYGQQFAASAREALSAYIYSTRGRFNCDITASSAPLVLQKRYPLHDPERDIEVRVPLRNTGPGLACGVTVLASSDCPSVVLSGTSLLIGDVSPGEFSVSVEALVVEPVEEFRFTLILEWSEMGGAERKSDMFQIVARAQRSDIDWANLTYWSPYSTHPAEGDAFVGRAELLGNLASRILRTPMESFYITGQKRVGKTSLAMASVEYAKARNPDVEGLNILWGEIASENPRSCVKQLGETIHTFLADHLPKLPLSEMPDYNGTLSPLVSLATTLHKTSPNKKFVIIIDEFDEIHQELYLSGNLAETFFANIRAISGVKNICLVLVGGENMPFVMERQGQKLNRFSGINLSYFSRSKEWEDYTLLVQKPSSGTLVWHEDAIAEIYNLTAGNPYFTNMVCAAVARSAVSTRDADITGTEVAEAAALELSSMQAHAFAHLWQDGIPKPVAEREPDILRRSRALCAIARTLRHHKSLTAQDISASKGDIPLSDSEIVPVLNDFVRRDVIQEDKGSYAFKLPLFQHWLADVGYAKLAADSLSEELAAAVQTDEEAARVQSAEIASLVSRWPTFRGTHASSEKVRAWLEQVDSNKHQRLLFTLLRGIKFLGEADVRARLRSSYYIIRESLPEFVKKSLKDRRNDIIVTYLDGEGKSGQYYAGLFAEENSISVSCISSSGKFGEFYESRMREHGIPSAVVVIDDIAATGGTMAENIKTFADAYGDILRAGTKLLVVTLLATATADKRIRGVLQNLEGIDADFRAGEVLGPDAYAFSDENPIWTSAADRDQAKALATDLGSRIYRNSPLGVGGLGLLVVLSNTVPNNSLPILHSAARQSAGASWKPLFERLTN